MSKTEKGVDLPSEAEPDLPTTVRDATSVTSGSSPPNRLQRWVNAFNIAYDSLARVVKLFLFLLVIVVVVWKAPYIDWSRTSNELISKHTPVQFQEPQASQNSATGQISIPPSPTKPMVSSTQSADSAQTQGNRDQTSTKSAEKRSERASSEVTTLRSPAQPTSSAPAADYLSVYQFGQLVFSVDKPYEINGGECAFDKLLLKGKPDYEKTFVYAGAEIKITRIEEYIGLLVSGGSVEGPVLLKVSCEVLRR